MKKIIVAIVLTGLAALGQSPATSPFTGKWRLNLEKSTANPGPKPTGSNYMQAYQFTVRPDGWVIGTNIGVNAQGVLATNMTVSHYDGKDYPSYGAGTIAELIATGKKTTTTMAYKVIDARTVQLTQKTDGKINNPDQTRIRAISADGKTMTDSTKGKNAQGQMVDNVQVFDRVP